jgi:hypothetical protein
MDGVNEIIIGCANYLLIFSYTGYGYVQEGGISGVGTYPSPGGIADWDNDLIPEVVVGAKSPGRVSTVSFTGSGYVIEWYSDYSTDRRSPRFCDIDDDGQIEIVAGGANGYVK